MGVPDLPIGERIRFYRGVRQQAVVAGLVGITPDYLYQIERGIKTPTIPLLHAIARELGVPTSALLGEGPAEPETDPVATAPSIARALLGYGSSAGTALVSTSVLRERVEAAWRTWQTSPTRFSDSAQIVPGLIADVEHAVRVHRKGTDAAARREVLRIAADLYFMLRSYCRRTGRVDLSLLAAERAIRAAEDADDPLRIAAAQWNLGHVLLADGEEEGAEQVALLGVEQLHNSSVSTPVPDTAAMSGALELVAVVASARRKGWVAARTRLRQHAAPQANRAGEGNVMWTVFGPTNVEVHNVSINMEAGEASEALRRADSIDISTLPSLERQFTFTLEVARCYDLRREDAAVLMHLLDLERLAPEDLARSPLAHSMIRGLVKRARPTFRRQVTVLAERIGLL